MMWHTHAAMGDSVTWLLTPFLASGDAAFVSVLMVFCVIGALVPDLDAVESKIKHVKVMAIKPLVPLSQAINSEFGHRGLPHSLWGWAGWTVLILPLVAVVGWMPVAALSLGYASLLAADACTRTGIPMLYPKHKSYHLLSVGMRVSTGPEYEEVFFVVFVSLILLVMLLRS
jgi:membrane-bound metal-dependent hydrolase YbcI (DUF457 family)